MNYLLIPNFLFLFVRYYFLETGSYYVALNDLELAMYSRLT